MKIVALLAVLLFHLTGLWSHIPSATRTGLADTAAGVKSAAVPQAAAPPLQLASIPVQTGNSSLNLTAGSSYAIDAATGTVLYSHNANAERPIASITKLVTTMVVLSQHSPNSWVTVPTLPTYASDDELIGLVPGEQYTVRDLVTAALVQSGDDAADAMALWDAGTKAKFAALMNAKMAEWGIKNTHFSNPSGLIDQGNYSTAASVAQIGRLAISDPLVKGIVDEQTATITSRTGRSISLSNIDTLLATGNFYGIKTGYTGGAGDCFVGLTRIDGHNVITVVLGSTDRFGDSQNLANWIGANWQWQ